MEDGGKSTRKPISPRYSFLLFKLWFAFFKRNKSTDGHCFRNKYCHKKKKNQKPGKERERELYREVSGKLYENKRTTKSKYRFIGFGSNFVIFFPYNVRIERTTASRRFWFGCTHKVGSPCVVLLLVYLYFSLFSAFFLPFFLSLRRVACGFYNAGPIVNRCLIVFESSISVHFIYRKDDDVEGLFYIHTQTRNMRT